MVAFCFSSTSLSWRCASSSRRRAARSRVARPTAASDTTRATVTATWVAASITTIRSAGIAERAIDGDHQAIEHHLGIGEHDLLASRPTRGGATTASWSCRSRPGTDSPPIESARSSASNTSAPGGSRSPCSTVSSTSSRSTLTASIEMSTSAHGSPLRGAAGIPTAGSGRRWSRTCARARRACARPARPDRAAREVTACDLAQALGVRRDRLEDEAGHRTDQALVRGADRAQRPARAVASVAWIWWTLEAVRIRA